MHGKLSPLLPWAIALLLALLLAGLVWSQRSAQQTGDSLVYARSASTGERLLHPHHLLFNVTLRGCHLALGFLLGADDPVLSGQVHGVLFLLLGCLGVMAFASLVLEEPWLGVGGLLLFGTLNGVMIDATQVYAYVPAASLMVWAATAAMAPSRRLGGRCPWCPLAIAWSAGVLYHQINVLFAVPLAALVAIRRERSERTRLVAAALAAGAVVLVAYVGAFQADGSARRHSFIQFCLDYAMTGSPTWGTADNLDRVGAAAILRNQAACVTSPRHRLGWTLVADLLLAAGLVVVAASRRSPERLRAPAATCMAWWLTLLGFVWWWMPSGREILLHTIPPALLGVLVLVAAAAGGSPTSRRRWAVLAVVVATASLNLAVNLRGDVAARRQPDDETSGVASDLAELAPGRGLVVARFAAVSAYRLRHQTPDQVSYSLSRLILVLQDGTHAPPLLERARRRGVVVDLACLDPNVRYHRARGVDHPDLWARVVLWLVDAVPAEGGRGLEVRSCSVQVASSGRPYLVVDSTAPRLRVEGVAGAFRMLQEAVRQGLGADAPQIAFFDWDRIGGKHATPAPARGPG